MRSMILWNDFSCSLPQDHCIWAHCFDAGLCLRHGWSEYGNAKNDARTYRALYSTANVSGSILIYILYLYSTIQTFERSHSDTLCSCSSIVQLWTHDIIRIAVHLRLLSQRLILRRKMYCKQPRNTLQRFYDKYVLLYFD